MAGQGADSTSGSGAPRRGAETGPSSGGYADGTGVGGVITGGARAGRSVSTVDEAEAAGAGIGGGVSVIAATAGPGTPSGTIAAGGAETGCPRRRGLGARAAAGSGAAPLATVDSRGRATRTGGLVAPSFSTRLSISEPAAASKARTAATAWRTVSDTTWASARLATVRRGDSAIATRNAVTAEVTDSASARLAPVSSATSASRLRLAAELVSLPGSDSRSSTASGTGSAGSGYARRAAGYSSRSTSRSAAAAACRPVTTAAWAASTGLKASSSPGAGRVVADSAPACRARASPIARRSAGGDSSSSIDSSSEKRSA
jgi:hypothetical protein